MTNRPLVLAIIDGFGYSDNKIGNAVSLAQKPCLDNFQLNYPHTLLQASGQVVGLDWGEPGNSETGHLSMGAGRIVKQYLSVINGAINNDSFYHQPVLLRSLQSVKNSGSKLHILGLLTSGSVHAHLKHLIAILDLIKKTTIPNIYLHLFTDGKDSGPKEGLALFKKIQEHIKNSPQIKIATLIGRNFAMERNNNWAKTQTAHNLFVDGVGNQTDNLEEKLKSYYAEGLTDEEVPPTVLNTLTLPLISEYDSLLFFNFREDSMRQITKSFIEKNFSYFPRKELIGLQITTLTKYFDYPNENFVFPPLRIKNNLAEWLSLNHLKQFHIAESEKYAHVTLFFNGLENHIYEGETDFFLESPRDLVQFPEMRSLDIAKRIVSELKRNYYDFFLVNFANADLISHLGNIDLVAKSIEKVDSSIGLIHEEVKKQEGILLITSDHGNAESLIYGATGERETKHNSSPVPFYLVSEVYRGKKFSGQTTGILPDIAPTILNLMNLPVPPEMTGQNLLTNLA